MVFPFHNWLVLIRILEKVNKIRIALSFCSKQTESSKCHNHMEFPQRTGVSVRYCKGRIARKFLIETLMSPALHCCHILSSKYDCKSFVIKPFLRFWPSLSWLQADSASCVWTPVSWSTKLCLWRLDESWRLAMQPLFCRLPSRRCGLLYLA